VRNAHRSSRARGRQAARPDRRRPARHGRERPGHGDGPDGLARLRPGQSRRHPPQAGSHRRPVRQLRRRRRRYLPQRRRRGRRPHLRVRRPRGHAGGPAYRGSCRPVRAGRRGRHPRPGGRRDEGTRLAHARVGVLLRPVLPHRHEHGGGPGGRTGRLPPDRAEPRGQPPAARRQHLHARRGVLRPVQGAVPGPRNHRAVLPPGRLARHGPGEAAPTAAVRLRGRLRPGHGGLPQRAGIRHADLRPDGARANRRMPARRARRADRLPATQLGYRRPRARRRRPLCDRQGILQDLRRAQPQRLLAPDAGQKALRDH